MLLSRFAYGICARGWKSNSVSERICYLKPSVCIVRSSLWQGEQERRNSSSVGSSDGLVVYSGPLSRQIRTVKIFSLLTSVTGIIAQPYVLQRAIELEASTPAIVGLCSFVGFFTFVTPLLLHFVTKKYVTTVVYDLGTDSYTATTYSLFIRQKSHNFKPGEAIVPDVPGMFTSVTVRGTPLFLDVRFFDDVHHYKRIMGYDKPMDFKLKQGTISPTDHEYSRKQQ